MTDEKPDFSLIKVDLSKFAKPADRLIKKVSDACGKIFDPTHLRRMAKAKRDVRKIEKLGELELEDEIQNRALERLIAVETKKQENLEEITYEALSHLTDEAEPENIEDDWLAHFFDRATLISDKDMKILWAKILAGEANKAETFSKRTVSLLSDLEKNEAHLFTQVCRFSIGQPGGSLNPFIISHRAKIYNDLGLRYRTLAHLSSIGLINFEPIAGFIIEDLNQNFQLSYFGTSVEVRLPEGEDKFLFGQVLFTQIGKELAIISGAQPVDGFLSYLKEDYLKKEIPIEF